MLKAPEGGEVKPGKGEPAEPRKIRFIKPKGEQPPMCLKPNDRPEAPKTRK
ncbi:hypothetical protein [Spirillospora sp. CA-294931]|uniref:hypothetical protein n=1 Tax=Spirillospora sp. CA-294931 TaxID=3240042 RepID=UPI003D89E991